MANDKIYYAIIMAGGSGLRLGSELPKQFIEIEGKSVLHRTVEKFLSLPFEVNIIIVMNPMYIDYWKQYCVKKKFIFKHILTKGGMTRFHSVKNGLRYVKEDSLVAIHDGVRPLVTTDLINKLFCSAFEKKAVIPVVPVVDSLRKIGSDGDSEIISREGIVAVQTPQVFDSRILLDSYNQAFSHNFTDDASVVERAGNKIYIEEGESLNFKITKASDLHLAERLITF